MGKGMNYKYIVLGYVPYIVDYKVPFLCEVWDGVISATVDLAFSGIVISYMVFFVQLRNLVWATSKHDVYLMSNYSVMHWSSLSCNLSDILNFSRHIAPNEVFEIFYVNLCTY